MGTRKTGALSKLESPSHVSNLHGSRWAYTDYPPTRYDLLPLRESYLQYIRFTLDSFSDCAKRGMVHYLAGLRLVGAPTKIMVSQRRMPVTLRLGPKIFLLRRAGSEDTLLLLRFIFHQVIVLNTLSLPLTLNLLRGLQLALCLPRARWTSLLLNDVFQAIRTLRDELAFRRAGRKILN